MITTRRPHIVIAGGGVAAVELVLALHDLAADRVRVTLIAPEPDFELRPLRTAEPFSADHVRRHALADLGAHAGADLVVDRLAGVDAARHAVMLASGHEVFYDSLVLAVGGHHVPALDRALTFTGDASSIAYNELLADVDEGYSRAVTFVVPPGATWPLPLYELALMTAREARAMGIDDARLRIVSPEESPLAIFGPAASTAVAGLLDTAGIAFRGSTYVRADADGRVELLPGGEVLDGRVVALPTMEGPAVPGVTADERGFIAVDSDGRVTDLQDVYAAGDGTTFPVKQGGLACQQADAIAELLAAAAGAPITPQPFRPVLRGRVLTGAGAQYLEHPLHGGAGAGAPPELRLWSAAHKVDGRYLSPWLAARDAGATSPGVAAEALVPAGTPPPHERDVEVEVELPGAYELGQAALTLDPYSPAR